MTARRPDGRRYEMTIGPVEYVVVAFPGNQFNGEIAPELARLVDEGTVRILDLIFIGKDAQGEVTAFEYDELEELTGFGEIDGDVGGYISPEDIDHAASGLEPNSSAALLIWEDVWAAPFAEAVRKSGGVVVEGGRIPHELVEAATSNLPSAN
jgi:hypothetical protein